MLAPMPTKKQLLIAAAEKIGGERGARLKTYFESELFGFNGEITAEEFNRQLASLQLDANGKPRVPENLRSWGLTN